MLKGKTKDARNITNLLLKIKDPYEILERKSKEGKELFDKSQKVMKEYNVFMKKALNEEKDRNVIVFRYHSDTSSFTADLANELIHRNPNCVIMVARNSEEQVRVSLRSGEKGVDLPKMLKSIFEEIDGDGGGHCLHPDTLLQLNDGQIVKIKDYKDNLLTAFDFKKNSVKFGEGKLLKPVIVKNIYNINASPYKIRASENHRFFVFKNNKIQEEYAKDLKFGDFIAGLKLTPILGKDTALPKVSNIYYYFINKKGLKILKNKRNEKNLLQREVSYKLKIDRKNISSWENGISLVPINSLSKLLKIYEINEDFITLYCNKKSLYNELKLPKKLSFEISQIFGYLIGDGCIFNNEIEFKDSDYNLLKKYKFLLKKYFDLKFRIFPVKNKNCYRLRIKSILFKEFLNNFAPELLYRSYNLIVPKVIQMSNKENVRGFLRGIFDAEGNVSDHNIVISMVDELFLRQLQLLFLRLGIISQIFSRKKIHNLIITDYYSLEIFYREIGSSSDKKLKQYKLMLKKMRQKNRNSTLRLLPLTYYDLVNISNKENVKGLSKILSHSKNRLHRNITNITFYKFLKLLSQKNKSLCSDLENLFNSTIFWCRIKDIKKINKKETFYDINVPIFGNYVANGLIVHNSHASAASIHEKDFNTFVEKVRGYVNK